MNYNHLTINERACVYQLKQLGMSIRKIAETLDRSPSTISRELKRNFWWLLRKIKTIIKF